MGNCLSSASEKSGNGTSNEIVIAATSVLNSKNGSFSKNLANAAKTIAEKRLQEYNFFSREAPSEEYISEANQVVPALIRMFSGCKDDQTSADVSDVSSFGIPLPNSSERSGGACTNSLLHTLKNHPKDQPPLSFAGLLVQMRKTLKERKYTQIPQLSASQTTFLQKEVFSVWNQEKRSGRSRALLIGINYYGTEAALNGCINDVIMMKNYLVSEGYSSAKQDMRLLTDDGKNDGKPTRQTILDGLKWLTEGAEAGDSLFLHFSGHGTQVEDKNSDEDDGMDEAICPVDYSVSGLIIDDLLFQLSAGTIKKGVNMVCLFDCCHSGTMMDLPYIFTANNTAVDALLSGEDLQMPANPQFNMEYAKKLVAALAKGLLGKVLKRDIGEDKTGAKREVLNVAEKVVKSGIEKLEGSGKSDKK